MSMIWKGSRDVQPGCRGTKAELFTGNPGGIVEQICGLEVVPVASTMAYNENVRRKAKELGIHLLQRDGSGFRCLLHSEIRPRGRTLCCIIFVFNTPFFVFGVVHAEIFVLL